MNTHMAVKTDYRVLKKDWIIYKIDLDNFEAKLWKEVGGYTEEEIDREINKFRKFVNRNDHPTAFVKREAPQQRNLIIPVL